LSDEVLLTGHVLPKFQFGDFTWIRFYLFVGRDRKTDLTMFEANVITVVGLFDHIVQPVQSDRMKPHPHSPAEAERPSLGRSQCLNR